MMTPLDVAKANGRRIAREARKTATVYTTATPARVHLTAVELDDIWGKRWFVMPDSEVAEFVGEHQDSLSDIDHAAKCWCLK